MEEAFLYGLTVGSMKDNIYMTKNKDTDSLIGQTEDATKEHGKMENKMEKVYIPILQENKDKEFGATEKKSDGLIDLLSNECR
jgi:hypothetical protein